MVQTRHCLVSAKNLSNLKYDRTINKQRFSFENRKKKSGIQKTSYHLHFNKPAPLGVVLFFI
jgi:hypothetical protein